MKTAIEWLVEEIGKLNNGQPTEAMIIYAKKLEKQQIIDAYDLGSLSEMQYPNPKTVIENGEQYYNETYGSKGSDETKTNLDRLPFPELVEEFAKYYEKVPVIEATSSQTETLYTEEQMVQAIKFFITYKVIADREVYDKDIHLYINSLKNK